MSWRTEIERAKSLKAEREAFEMKKEEYHKQALAQDVRAMSIMGHQGDVEGIAGILNSRVQTLQQNGGDWSESLEALQALQSGDPQKIGNTLADLAQADQIATANGYLPPITGESQFVGTEGGMAITGNPQTGFSATPIANWQEDPSQRTDRDIKQRRLELDLRSEDRMAKKLSAAAEKALMASQDAHQKNIMGMNEARLIGQYFSDLGDNNGGALVSFEEGLKAFFGSQDEVTEWRNRFQQVRVSEGLNNLPPGVASDTDVALAMKPLPPNNAPPSRIVSYLRGVERINRLGAAYNLFKSEYISNKGSPRSLIRSWRKTYDIETKDGKKRKISEAEIYEAAINRGMSAADVKAQLGIGDE